MRTMMMMNELTFSSFLNSHALKFVCLLILTIISTVICLHYFKYLNLNSTQNSFTIDDSFCHSKNANTELENVQPFQPLRIGVLIMATGRYASFTKNLIPSARKHFLTDKRLYNVTFVVFTDHADQVAEGDDVKIVFQHRLGWPSDTLWRCQIYINSTALLHQNFDFIYSLDSDMIVVDTLGPEILGEMVGVLHPGYFHAKREKYTYETNPESCAYIGPDEGWQYFAGGFYGGRLAEVLKMCHATNACAERDWSRGFVAVWHDESQLNRYFMDHPPTVILSPAYVFFERYGLPYTPKVIGLYKENTDDLRKEDERNVTEAMIKQTVEKQAGELAENKQMNIQQ